MSERAMHFALLNDLETFILRVQEDTDLATVGASVRELKHILLKHVQQEIRGPYTGGVRRV